VPEYNARRRGAAESGSAFIPYVGRPLEHGLCVQEDRQVGCDNCVQWKGLSLQIPPQRHCHHYVKATVRVHESGRPDRPLRRAGLPRLLRP